MPCIHKFYEDLQLEYVNWEPRTLFIGTFNPEWNECENNYADWFYGRTANNEFWCILPKVYGQPSLMMGNRESWINFCRANAIAITDIIEQIDADANNPNHRNAICKFKDEDLENFEVQLNDIPMILNNYPSINQICITRSTPNAFWDACLNATVEYVNGNPDRNILVRRLRSPSRGSRRGVVGNFCDFLSNRWIEQGFQL